MDKKNALKERPTEFENRLFFAARNLAIENILLKIEKLFPNKFNLQVNWIESSFSKPSIRITLSNPRESKSWISVDFIISVERDTILTYSNDHVSNCFYYFKNTYRNFSPFKNKHVEEFNEIFLNQENIDFYKDLIDGINYPFNRKRLSSF